MRPYYASLRKTVTPTAFRHIKMPLPPLDEQQCIADYLDERCAAIDEVRRTIEDEVEALRRLRKATIHRAVTKGLNKGVPMRDSDVEWIGEMPETWSLVLLRRCIVKTGNGLTRRGAYDAEGTMVLKLKNIHDGFIDYSYQNRMYLTKQELATYRLVSGDFLFVRVNGSRDLVGKSAIYRNTSEDVAYNDHIIRIAFDERLCNQSYMFWYFQSDVSRREIDLRVKTSAGQFTVSGDDIKRCRFVLPGLSEQQRIADYLDDRCAAIDSVIDTRTKQLERLEDYRKALVFAYVTGKKEVPSHE